MADEPDRPERSDGLGGRFVGKRSGGGRGGRDDAVGCAQDADDACEGETAHGANVGENYEGERAESFFRGHGAEGGLD